MIQGACPLRAEVPLHTGFLTALLGRLGACADLTQNCRQEYLTNAESPALGQGTPIILRFENEGMSARSPLPAIGEQEIYETESELV